MDYYYLNQFPIDIPSETAKKCERARLEYDAFKTKLHELGEAEKKTGKVSEKKAQVEKDLEQFKQKYESLRDDTLTKLELVGIPSLITR